MCPDEVLCVGVLPEPDEVLVLLLLGLGVFDVVDDLRDTRIIIIMGRELRVVMMMMIIMVLLARAAGGGAGRRGGGGGGSEDGNAAFALGLG